MRVAVVGGLLVGGGGFDDDDAVVVVVVVDFATLVVVVDVVVEEDEDEALMALFSSTKHGANRSRFAVASLVNRFIALTPSKFYKMKTIIIYVS